MNIKKQTKTSKVFLTKKTLRLWLLFISFVLGIFSFFILINQLSKFSFGSINCQINKQITITTLILGEIFFMVFNYSLFFLIKSIDIKNIFIRILRVLVLIGQVLFFLLFIGIGLMGIIVLSSVDVCNQVTLQIVGRSMEPTFQDQQFTTEHAFIEKRINRGCVVIMKAGVYEGQKGVVIKRVIGLPGETIRISKEGVFINNNILDEPYALIEDQNDSLIDREWKIPENSYFIMGDNRNHSYDSRDLGPIHIENLEGYVVDEKLPTGLCN